MLGHIANVLEKPRGRSMTVTFDLQSAHADGADEIDALLDDVLGVGFNGVNRVIGASLIVKVVKTRGCRPRHMLVTVAGMLEGHRTGSAERAMALTNCWGRSRRQWKGRRSREAWPSIESGSAKEDDGGGWQVFFRILEKLGERNYLARRTMRAARAAFLFSFKEPACHVELSAFQSNFQPSLCPSSSGVVTNDGDVVPPAWRCESCISSMAWSRALRAADSASRISPLSF